MNPFKMKGFFYCPYFPERVKGNTGKPFIIYHHNGNGIWHKDNTTTKILMLMTTILLLAGILLFAGFFFTIKSFEKI